MQTEFTVREVARIFGLKESRLRYWAQTGFINPTGKLGGKRVYTFSDLIEVRAAKELLDNGIPLQRVRRNLKALREGLPGTNNLLGRLRIRSDGDTLVVVDGTTTVDPVSGQSFLDFDTGDLDRQIASVLELAPAENDAAPPIVDRQSSSKNISKESFRPVSDNSEESAYGWFLRALNREGDPSGEEESLAAYSTALELDPGLAAAHTNIGNIYYRRGDRTAALQAYETACALDPDQPEARYNMANIYEEEGEFDLAIAEYRRALKLSPDFADVHFNLALALEQVGGRHQAAGHWRRYLDLTANKRDQLHGARQIAHEHINALDAQQDHP